MEQFGHTTFQTSHIRDITVFSQKGSKQIMADTDDWHRQQYEASLRWAKLTDAPSWDELTEEQRISIRQINMQHQSKMNALGKAIAAGDKIDINDFLD